MLWVALLPPPRRLPLTGVGLLEWTYKEIDLKFIIHDISTSIQSVAELILDTRIYTFFAGLCVK